MSNVPFPLVALLTERPSSQRRVQVSRRFALGLASIMQRRQQRRFRSLTTKRSEPQTRSAKVPGSSERSLTSSFAELSFLHETDAKNRLRDFITYGAIGLLSRAERHRAIHPQLSSWLRLIKYGRLDGRIPWPEVMAQLDIYRRELGLQRPVSPSLARAVFNSIRRPAFWHGGQGEATIRLRQRGALTLQSAAQLHANWIIASVELASPLTDNLGASIGHKGYLVVVIEEAGGFPLAIWPCATRPTLREVCLAVYQAIWHPGAENWPVKGIPEHLLIAADLVQGNTADLERAAAYLLSAIEVQPHTRLVKGKTKQLLLRVATQANKLLAQLEIGERGASRVLREMETWIISEFFSYHSAAPVWQEIARHGVVMPGHDTPAAGWLLPTNSDLLEVVDDRVTWQGRHYLARSALGKTVRCREYPLPVAVPHAADGLFGERLSTGASSTLVYLDADRRR